MLLNLAGWLISADIHPAELNAAIASRYAPFCITDEGRATNLIIEIAAEETARASGSLLNAELTTRGANFMLDGPDFRGMIFPLDGRASLRVASNAVAREIEYFLRVAVSLFAYHAGGLLIHCAGLKTGSGVYLFAGQSGSGNSRTGSQLSHRQQPAGPGARSARSLPGYRRGRRCRAVALPQRRLVLGCHQRRNEPSRSVTSWF